jgi:hypothetical protein
MAAFTSCATTSPETPPTGICAIRSSHVVPVCSLSGRGVGTSADASQ